MSCGRKLTFEEKRQSKSLTNPSFSKFINNGERVSNKGIGKQYSCCSSLYLNGKLNTYKISHSQNTADSYVSVNTRLGDSFQIIIF